MLTNNLPEWKNPVDVKEETVSVFKMDDELSCNHFKDLRRSLSPGKNIRNVNLRFKLEL